MPARIPFLRLQVKEMDDDARTFTGLAATWDLDQGGDVILKGAFRDSLKEWKSSNRIIPLLDSHDGYSSVEAVIGQMIDAKETTDGLEATFQLLDQDRKAEAVYRRIKGGFVDGLSIGYRPVETITPDEKERLKGIWRKLKKIELKEVSVVLWPMNTGARIEAVKSALGMFSPDEPLSDEERKEFRSLAGRIGNLLAARSATKADPDDEPPQDPPQDPEATPDPDAPKPPAPAATRKAQDEDDVPGWKVEALKERLARVKANRKPE